MAFNEKSMAIDLRPLNVGRSGADETRIAPPQVTTSGRAPDGYYPTTGPPSMPLYFTDASGTAFPSMASANPWWAPPVQPPPQSSSCSISSPGYAYSPNLGSGAGGDVAVTGVDQGSEDVGDDCASGKKVKFLCSFGGKILPRPSDGMLRYVGGQTRIITVRRDVTFGELVKKMVDTCGQPVVIKYQLPDEDLDALVSVSCPDDLDNMMEEFQKLQDRSPDGSAKLRVFLFSASELDPSGLVHLRGLQDTGQRYVDAVNGVAETVGGGIARNENIASVASTQNSDVSVSEVFETVIAQEVSGTQLANMVSPRSDAVASYDNAPKLDTFAPPLMVPANVPPHLAHSQPEILSQPHGQQQQQSLGYDLHQAGMNFQSHASPCLGGYIDHHQDALSRGASHVVYPNPQVLGAPRPILIHPQYHDAPNLCNQQFVPVQMTMPHNPSHLSINTNVLQPLPPSQPSQRFAEPNYNNAYETPVGGGYGWPQVPPHNHATFSEGWVAHQQVVPATTDCYMCQKALPHAHSDSVVQDQKIGQSNNAADMNPIYQSLHLSDITRLQAAQNQGNQGLMGLANVPVSSSEDAIKQHLMSKPVNVDTSAPNAVAYHEQFIPETSIDYPGKVPAMAFREDGVRFAIPSDQARPVDFRMENLPMKPDEILPSTEEDKPELDLLRQDDILEQVPLHTLGREALPNSAFIRPSIIQDTSQKNLNEISPGAETIASNTSVQASTSPHNWDAVENSKNSLFSNQDPWNMRHETHFPPPKPSKFATKREASDICQNGELGTDANFVEVQPTTEQAQPGKGSAEERIKQQLQATAEGVAASVLHSSVPSNVDFSSQETSFSEAVHEMEGQTNSDAALQTKMEAMNIKSDKANLGFSLSDGLGRLQIIKNGDLEELRELGSGTFGTVYHGKWRGTDVAIKRINDRCFAGKPSEQERMRDDFWNEAIKLADLHHPNVVAFYGVVLDGPGGSVATVTEYMVNGSLRTALQKNEKNLDKRKRLLIAMDVAFGMEYLHSKNIVHFDLKSDNLLVNLRDPHRPICKVGDLGLSKVKCQTLISGGVRGTLPWMAPELLNGSSSLVSEKVDVFSFGIVMWELLTGEEPYADLHYGAIIGGIVSNTLRPLVPENCDPEWRSLMERCWSAEPPERPNFTEIANDLRLMAAKIPAKGQMPAATSKTNA